MAYFDHIITGFKYYTKCMCMRSNILIENILEMHAGMLETVVVKDNNNFAPCVFFVVVVVVLFCFVLFLHHCVKSPVIVLVP